MNPAAIDRGQWSGRPQRGELAAPGSPPPPSTPWRDQARRGSPASLRNGLYASNRDAPRAPGTEGRALAVGGGLAVGGVAYSGGYFESPAQSSSSFSFSLAVGGGWGGFGFSYSNGNWFAPPCYSWAPCGGWAPHCGWRWSPAFCGWGGGWGPSFCSPWWCPPVWSDPWCAPVCWSSCWSPNFALCFGWSAWSTSFVFSPVVFQPAPPPIVVVQPPQVVFASAETAWSLLAAGYDAEAMEQFALLQTGQPGNPGNTVGYALAQAMLGLDGSSVAAFRAALRDRGEALLLVPTDPNLRFRLEALAARLQDRARALSGGAGAADALFQLACVQAVLYDNANAYFSINSAIERGDRDPAAWNVKALVQMRLEA